MKTMGLANSRHSALDHFLDTRKGKLSFIAAIELMVVVFMYIPGPEYMIEESVSTGTVTVRRMDGQIVTNVPDNIRAEHYWVP